MVPPDMPDQPLTEKLPESLESLVVLAPRMRGIEEAHVTDEQILGLLRDERYSRLHTVRIERSRSESLVDEVQRRGWTQSSGGGELALRLWCVLCDLFEARRKQTIAGIMARVVHVYVSQAKLRRSVSRSP